MEVDWLCTRSRTRLDVHKDHLVSGPDRSRQAIQSRTGPKRSQSRRSTQLGGRLLRGRPRLRDPPPAEAQRTVGDGPTLLCVFPAKPSVEAV
jgi:hypothetical protein